MILEIILVLYSLGILGVLDALLRDRYVEINKGIILVYSIASLFWPLTILFYFLDKDK